MTDLRRQHEYLNEVYQWFAAKDIGLFLTEEDGAFWAHLFSMRGLRLFAPRYGNGDSPEAAAESAKQRYLTEEG